MAREIFVVDAENNPASGDKTARLVFWLAAPANRVRPNPTASPGIPPSTVLDPVNGVSWGYTAAERDAVRAGTIVVEQHELASGEISPPVNLANFRTAASAKYAVRQQAITDSALGIPTIGMARTDGSWGAAP